MKFASKKWAQRYPSATHALEPSDELILREEPLEIRVLGEPLVTTMRTPGDDHKLAVGFLFAEGLIHSMQDLLTISHCGRLGDEGYGNTLEITPAHNVELSLKSTPTQRGTISTSSCGVCGRQSIQDLLDGCGVIPTQSKINAEVIAGSTEKLRLVQHAFSLTGGSHAAIALNAQGELLCGYEDIGRHNAVDKVIGALLYANQLREAAVLVVSGRVSFEIVQKAAMAKIPVLCSVSAASTLAIELAQAVQLTLACFVRNGGFTLYSHPARIT